MKNFRPYLIAVALLAATSGGATAQNGRTTLGSTGTIPPVVAAPQPPAPEWSGEFGRLRPSADDGRCDSGGGGEFPRLH